MKSINIIITGVTGMVGEGVAHIALEHPAVASVLALTRKPSGISHPKFKEIVHADFMDISAIEKQLAGYDACLFCLGVTSLGKKEPEYFKMTHTLTLGIAEKLATLNPLMTFNYISGSGTDSTEKGKRMWARVKGKTENDLMKLPFKSVYAFRPAFIRAIPGMKRTLPFYKYVGWIFPIGRALSPGAFCTLKELALAMIVVSIRGYEKKVIEGEDIIELAKKHVNSLQ